MYRKWIEREIFLNSILSEFHQNMDFRSAMTKLLRELKLISDCSCIGIRLEDQGDFPYYVYDGFPEDFILRESSLCEKDQSGTKVKAPVGDDYNLECMCGNIIRRRFDPRQDFFTRGGSFWSSNTSKLLASTTVKDRQSSTRNYCNSCGYETVLLVPIKSNDKNIGLLQFNDKRVDLFTEDFVAFIEILGQVIGIFIANRLILSDLKRSEKARRESEDENFQKSMFLSNMSHEIRTPMNGIIGMTQLLEDTQLSEVQRDMLQTIKNSSNLLLGIINDVLDFSKMEAGMYKLSEEAFSIHELMFEVIRMGKVLAEKKGLALKSMMDMDIPAVLIGDPMRVKQIMMNLISNAVKFTQNGGVDIKVVGLKVSEDILQLEVEVTDTGIGISEENISRLFNVFTQLDDTSTKTYQGSGLGLAICKQLVNLMGGGICVDSTIGVGSCFKFSIPLKIDNNTNMPGKRTAYPSEGKIELSFINEIHILLIEDDYVNQRVIEKFFASQQGIISLYIAKNAREGFEMLNKLEFDLLLLDIQLPDMNGYEIAQKIRVKENEIGKGVRRLPIIATTAYALDKDREKCLSSGIDDYVTKPINFTLLTKLINRYILNY